MWTILSGKESLFSEEMPDESQLKPEYLTVSDIATNLTPEISPIKVNKLLAELGYQTKIGKSWKATKKGEDQSFEEELGDSKTYLKWNFEIIAILSSHLSLTYTKRHEQRRPPHN